MAWSAHKRLFSQEVSIHETSQQSRVLGVLGNSNFVPTSVGGGGGGGERGHKLFVVCVVPVYKYKYILVFWFSSHYIYISSSLLFSISPPAVATQIGGLIMEPLISHPLYATCLACLSWKRAALCSLVSTLVELCPYMTMSKIRTYLDETYIYKCTNRKQVKVFAFQKTKVRTGPHFRRRRLELVRSKEHQIQPVRLVPIRLHILLR